MPVRKTYHVYRENIDVVGSTKIERDASDNRIVKMTEAEAQYWLDQGAIGVEPHNPENDGGLMREPSQEANQQRTGRRRRAEPPREEPGQ